MGDCLIPAVANYRQDAAARLSSCGIALPMMNPPPNAAQHLAVVHRIAEGHAFLQGEA